MSQFKEKKGQSLPRHTLMAPIGKRITAFLVDAALTLLFTIVLAFGAVKFAFNPSIDACYEKLYPCDFNSHLFYYDEESKTRKQYKSEGNYQLYMDVLSYYYLHYLTGEGVEIPEGYTGDPDAYKAPNYKEYVSGTETLPVNYYTVAWFNENILEIKEDEPSATSTAYFMYDKTGDVIDKTKIGVRRSEHYSTKQGKVVEVTEGETAAVLYEKYKQAYFGNLMNQNFYRPYLDKITFLTAVSWLIPAVLASLISYVIIPMFMKNNASIGKKIMKLGLCAIDGYKMQKYQLLLRVTPLILTLALIFLLPLPSYYIAFSIAAVIFMVSGGLTAASPKHSALHDYTGRTLVIDAESSIIFDSEIDEEEFIEAEDLQ